MSRVARTVLLLGVALALPACSSGKKRQTRSSDAAPVEPIKLPGDGPAGAADEAEPNDTDDTAMPLPLGGTIHGRVEPAFTDSDHYRIDVPAAGTLAIELSAVDGTDLVLEVHDAAGTVLARSDRGGAKTREGVPNLGVQPGRYTAVVRGKKPVLGKGKRPPPAAPTLPYDITAQAITPPPAGEREPDDDRGTANDLIVGDPVTGFIGWTDDADVWKLAVEALSAKNVLELEVGPVEATAFTLELADAAGQPLLVRKAPRGAGIVVRAIRPKVAPGAPPFLYVTLKALPSNPESPYTLRVTAKDPEPDSEEEPNDTVEKPMPFPADRTVLPAHWSPGDVDCFAIPPDPAARTLEVTVTPTEMDLSAELLVDGKVVARSEVKGKGAVEKLAAPVPANGAAVLRVRGLDAGAEGGYEIKLGEGAPPK